MFRRKKYPANSKKRSRKNKGLISFIQSTFENSSIYALAQIGQSPSPVLRVLWLIVLGTTAAGCCFQVYRFLDLYFQYPVIVSLKVEQATNLDFPAVTICNLNRIDASKFENCFDDNGTLIKLCIPFNPVFGIRQSSKPQGKPPLFASERHAALSCSSNRSEAKQKGDEKYLKFFDKYFKLKLSDLSTVGHLCKHVFQKCSFNDRTCLCNDFHLYKSTQYGNCFTFNWENHLKGTPFGSGLELEIDLKSSEYLSISPTLGSRIIVHSPSEDAHPEEKGINISPGYEVTVSLRKSQITRLKSPYQDHCIDYEPGGPPETDSPAACMQVCMQKHYFKRCGCLEPYLVQILGNPKCNISNTKDMCCLDGVLGDMQGMESSPCECPLPCVSSHFHEVISMAKWPSRAYYFEKLDYEDSNDLNELKKYRNNFAKVNVRFVSSEVISYEQTPKFDDSELLSHLGGEFGLWLGLSLAAIFEFVETFVTLTCYMINYFYVRVKKGAL
ncbi:hypothetical protein JTE90_023993 [Oedothorax gibbosus]|uniref:Uncharacterized protein n=1 Tax=Oedothorax gibbosus TaxID=931172 RepID=A0AAV6TH17_9ARAC|nr:hypothetical protein JTE90_023993 [Oedothorax gibbosus]